MTAETIDATLNIEIFEQIGRNSQLIGKLITNLKKIQSAGTRLKIKVESQDPTSCIDTITLCNIGFCPANSMLSYIQAGARLNSHLAVDFCADQVVELENKHILVKSEAGNYEEPLM